MSDLDYIERINSLENSKTRYLGIDVVCYILKNNNERKVENFMKQQKVKTENFMGSGKYYLVDDLINILKEIKEKKICL